MTYQFSFDRIPDREEFVITKDGCVQDSWVRGQHNRWVFKPDPKGLDDLYAHFLNEDVPSIATEDGRNAYWRGDQRVHFAGGGTDFEIVKSKTRFVVEDDSQRFTQMACRIANFVVRSSYDHVIPIEIDLCVETEDGEVQACELYIGSTYVLEWKAGGWEPLPTLLNARILPGSHELNGSYRVGEKLRHIRWPLQVNAEKIGFQLVLKSDTFELKQQ